MVTILWAVVDVEKLVSKFCNDSKKYILTKYLLQKAILESMLCIMKYSISNSECGPMFLKIISIVYNNSKFICILQQPMILKSPTLG